MKNGPTLEIWHSPILDLCCVADRCGRAVLPHAFLLLQMYLCYVVVIIYIYMYIYMYTQRCRARWPRKLWVLQALRGHGTVESSRLLEVDGDVGGTSLPSGYLMGFNGDGTNIIHLGKTWGKHHDSCMSEMDVLLSRCRVALPH